MRKALIVFIFMPNLLLALPKIAVVNFDATKVYNGGRVISEQLSEYVVDELVNSGLFEVIERTKLNSIMTELGFSASGMVDINSAVQMGRQLGAQYLLTGRVISVSSQKTQFKGYGVSTENEIYTLSSSIRILNVETGAIVFSTKEKSSHTVNAGGGLSIEMSNVYEPLVEEMAASLVMAISDSPKLNVKQSRTNTTEKVTVIFKSIPEQADIEIDGVFYGNAGTELEVPSGLHNVKISISGYDIWEKKVMLKNNMKITATLSLKD